MNLQNKIIEAKQLIGLHEGSKAYVSDKGRVKIKKEFSQREFVLLELEVKKGVVYVYEKGKQIEPAKKRKSVSRLRNSSDEVAGKDSE